MFISSVYLSISLEHQEFATFVFSLYMLPLGKIISSFKISYHCYADDIQLYIYFSPDRLEKLSLLQNCFLSLINGFQTIFCN